MSSHTTILRVLFFGSLALEQICCFFPKTFPYRLGIPVMTMQLPAFEESRLSELSKSTQRLSIYMHNGAAYIKYRYPQLTLGPCIFVAVLEMCSQHSTLKIKSCPLISLAIALMTIGPLVFGTLRIESFVNIIYIFAVYAVIAVALVVFYNKLLSCILSELKKCHE